MEASPPPLFFQLGQARTWLSCPPPSIFLPFVAWPYLHSKGLESIVFWGGWREGLGPMQPEKAQDLVL